jgi:hypothetical protein
MILGVDLVGSHGRWKRRIRVDRGVCIGAWGLGGDAALTPWRVRLPRSRRECAVMGGRWLVAAPGGVLSASMDVTRRVGSDDGPDVGQGCSSSSRWRGGDDDDESSRRLP